MKILLVGGGSGGHVTPIIALAKVLSAQNPAKNSENSAKNPNEISRKTAPEIRILTDKKFFEQTEKLAKSENLNVKISRISSGKLRRYANLNFFYKYFSWYHIRRTHIPNLVDSFRIFGGFVESFRLLKKWRPDVIFAKGGYVCLPVGIAAHFLKIPLIIHDSDTVAGLTNRILARFASAILTGAPTENYPNYPKEITKFVGIPVRAEFRKTDENSRKKLKEKLNLDPAKKLIFVAGGGGGATIFSQIFRKIAPEIIREFDAQIFLLTGKGKGFSVSDFAKSFVKNEEKSGGKFDEKFAKKMVEKIEENFVVKDFISGEYPELLNAADIFVTRAGATSMAEAAVSETATIIVPSPFLAGDHQSKNAEIFAKNGAAISLKQNETDDKFDEKLARELCENLTKLLGKNGEKIREKLGENLAKFAKPDALKTIAKTILEIGEKDEKNENNREKFAKNSEKIREKSSEKGGEK